MLEDLSFLDTVFPRIHLATAQRYQQADWLASSYDDEVWECCFEGASATTLDWRVRVGAEGLLLTSPRHRSLWETFRSWLILSTHPDTQAGSLWSTTTKRIRFSVVVDWIDYFLLRADHLGLPEHGLLCLSQDELVAALHAIGSATKKCDGIYRWPERMTSYLRNAARQLGKDKQDAIIHKFPFIAEDVPDEDDRLTALSTEEIISARAYLWTNGYYNRAGREASCRWHVKPSRLVPLMYPDTLRRSRGKRFAPELNLWAVEPRMKELLAASVSDTQQKRMSRPRLVEYARAISRLGLLANVGLPVPVDTLRVVDGMRIMDSMQLKGTGRYKTLPAAIVFFGLRRAIEFVLRHGEDLVTTYLASAKAAKEAGVAISVILKQHIAPALKQHGVERWSVAYIEMPPRGRPRMLSKADYYAEFRSNMGLWDLLRVLYGAVQLIVGTLMARRIGELTDLQAGQCLDKSGRYLIFDNRKSGVAGHRDSLAKPIPPIAVRAVRQLERLQDGLIEAGLLQERTGLFSHPKARSHGVVARLKGHFNSNLDYFCDYMEVPLDSEGRRYYIRQHQLRRFFAMVFFWSNSFGGLDTLRDFLGHTDAEHLYRYITESTPGEVLKSVKAEWAGEAVKIQWAAAEALADLVGERFGTRNFRLLRDDELAEYIEDLLEDGRVEIEPEFLDARGEYRILIKVLPKETAA